MIRFRSRRNESTRYKYAIKEIDADPKTLFSVILLPSLRGITFCDIVSRHKAHGYAFDIGGISIVKMLRGLADLIESGVVEVVDK